MVKILSGPHRIIHVCGVNSTNLCSLVNWVVLQSYLNGITIVMFISVIWMKWDPHENTKTSTVSTIWCFGIAWIWLIYLLNSAGESSDTAELTGFGLVGQWYDPRLINIVQFRKMKHHLNFIKVVFGMVKQKGEWNSLLYAMWLLSLVINSTPFRSHRTKNGP